MRKISVRKKVLIFIDWFLPGYKAGGPIQSVANIVEHLSDSYEFWIVTRNTDYLETKPYDNVISDKWMKISNNKNVMYLSKKEVNVKNIKRLIKTTAFDTIYINGIYSFYFSILPLLVANKLSQKVKIIVAPRGMLSASSVKIKRLRKSLFLNAAKMLGVYRKAVFHLSSRLEVSEVEKLKLRQKQNFIALNLPPKYRTKLISRANKQEGELRLVSIARISPEKNTLYAIECLSNFKYKGKIQFDLYGSIYDKVYWQSCQKQILNLPSNINVSYKGSVDNNLINSILTKYDLMFLPSRGENFGHSIIESLMCGIPVIISDQTPWQNLTSKKAGWDISLDNQHGFAKVIQQAIDMDNCMYQEMQSNAVKYVKHAMQIDKLIPLYVSLFE